VRQKFHSRGSFLTRAPQRFTVSPGSLSWLTNGRFSPVDKSD
jgi:hypothetical protein